MVLVEVGDHRIPRLPRLCPRLALPLLHHVFRPKTRERSATVERAGRVVKLEVLTVRVVCERVERRRATIDGAGDLWKVRARD